MHTMHATNLLLISFASVARTPTPTSPPLHHLNTYNPHRLARAPPYARNARHEPAPHQLRFRGPDADANFTAAVPSKPHIKHIG
ncbi:hypothetical protein PF003_g24286 [Phytophthora fragariae]|nr:hypothetical protein PF003_g24286 [Phytophthora fragariae]